MLLCICLQCSSIQFFNIALTRCSRIHGNVAALHCIFRHSADLLFYIGSFDPTAGALTDRSHHICRDAYLTAQSAHCVWKHLRSEFSIVRYDVTDIIIYLPVSSMISQSVILHDHRKEHGIRHPVGYIIICAYRMAHGVYIATPCKGKCNSCKHGPNKHSFCRFHICSVGYKSSYVFSNQLHSFFSSSSISYTVTACSPPVPVLYPSFQTILR